MTQTLTHDWIWQAIESLASSKGLSTSGLAKLADLDPTTFNRSKRFTPEGRPRWPSTESISKILKATGTTLDEFAALNFIAEQERPHEAETPDSEDIPMVGEVRDATVTSLRNEVLARRVVAARAGRHADARFALSVGDGSLEPVYSRGHTLIASIAERFAAGDRVIIKPIGRSPMPRLLLKESPQRLELAPFDTEQQRIRVARQRVDWIARIIWVRQ